MSVYLRTKFQVSSKILTGVRQAVISPPPPLANGTPKNPTLVRFKEEYTSLTKTNMYSHNIRLVFKFSK